MKFRGTLALSVVLAISLILPISGAAKPHIFAGDPVCLTKHQVLRQYPIPGATEVLCGTGIGITGSEKFDPALLSANCFTVTGSSTGQHSGRVYLSRDGATAIFRPWNEFNLFETVLVVFSARSISGALVTDTFQFVTKKHHLTHHSTTPPDQPSSLLPLITVTADNSPMPGRLFLNSTGQPDLGNLLVLNEDGRLLKYHPTETMDFQVQPNGQWTYFISPDSGHMGMDSNFTPIRSYRCTNGVSADPHDFICSADGSYTMLGVIKTTADMRPIVAGGDSNATIESNVIQRFDASDSLVFEWRGLDHYDIKDAIHEDLTSSLIDFEHANSIDIDSDGNYLLSNRSLSEITKIDGRTGAMIWRFGGAHNQFTIQNDSVGFSYQHDARRLPNGHITFFDNGNYRETGRQAESRAVEYHMDTSTMKAWLVWEYRHSPPVRAAGMGSVQRLPNGNTLIGWGVNATVNGTGGGSTVTTTEVTADKQVVFELAFDNAGPPLISYRARKYPYPTAAGVNAWSAFDARRENSFAPTIFADKEGDAVWFDTPQSEWIVVTVRDVLGRSVQSVFEGMSAGGPQKLELPTAGLANGIYFCIIQSASGTVVRRFALKR